MMFVPKIRLFNIPIILNIIGIVLLIEAATLIITLIVCLIYGEDDWMAFTIVAGTTAMTGLALVGFVRIDRTAMSANDGILITALSWLVVAVFGAAPFLISTHPVSVTDALFESMSGFTTTGASAMTDIDHLGYGMNMWRALTQLIGGIGIITFTLVLVPMLNKPSGMRLMAAESTDFSIDKTTPRIKQTARNLSIVYFGLTLICTLFLWAGPMSLYESLIHAFATLSTGGFSSYGSSIMHFDSLYIKIVLIIFMFLGATNFTLIVYAGKGDFSPILRNITVRVYVYTILIFLLLFIGAFTILDIPFTFEGSIVDPLFQIISTITSTGFSCADFEKWGPLVLLMLFILMYSGACAGSTSGGVKLDRMIVFFKSSRNEISSTINRNTMFTVKDGDKTLAPYSISRIVTFMGIYAFTLLLGGLTIAAMGVDTSDSFFASFSCTSNIGLGYGITGVNGSYSLLPVAARWILIFLMYAGRLELMAIFVLFVPSFWRR